MVQISFKGRQRTVPSCVDELTPVQYAKLLNASMLYDRGIISEEDLRRAILSMMAGVTDYTIYREPVRSEMEGQLQVTADFLTTDQNGATRVALASCRNLLPEFHGWKGPGDMFNGISFGQFLEALDHYTAANDAETGQEANREWEELTRALYSSPTETVRPPVPLVVHCATYFSTVWHQIATEPVTIGGKEIDFTIIFKSSGGRAQYDDHTGWAGVVMEVAKDGPFGKKADVDGSPFWDVMLYLYKCKFEYLHQKKTKPKK